MAINSEAMKKQWQMALFLCLILEKAECARYRLQIKKGLTVFV